MAAITSSLLFQVLTRNTRVDFYCIATKILYICTILTKTKTFFYATYPIVLYGVIVKRVNVDPFFILLWMNQVKTWPEIWP